MSDAIPLIQKSCQKCAGYYYVRCLCESVNWSKWREDEDAHVLRIARSNAIRASKYVIAQLRSDAPDPAILLDFAANLRGIVSLARKLYTEKA